MLEGLGSTVRETSVLAFAAAATNDPEIDDLGPEIVMEEDRRTSVDDFVSELTESTANEQLVIPNTTDLTTGVSFGPSYDAIICDNIIE